MSQLNYPEGPQLPHARYAAGLAIWGAGWIALRWLDGVLDLAGLGMLLVLIAALASLWLPLLPTLLLGVLAVLAFNWMFVPPRGSFAINFEDDAVLLLVMAALNAIIAGLMSVLRSQARHAQRQARAADALRVWSERLNEVHDVQDCLPELRQALQALSHSSVALMALRGGLPPGDDQAATVLLGEPDAEQLSGLWHCMRSGQPLGPRTGRYEALANVYLPLRGRDMAYGAVLVAADLAGEAEVAAQARDLCDRMGAALERQYLQRQQEASRHAAQEQELRATLLAAVAHEYRTPLATIMGAASMLEQQTVRLDAPQREQLALRIVNEVAHLRQMTGNVLQLARLDAPDGPLRCDWESAEDIIGALMQRAQPRAGEQRLVTEVEAELPLLWCDAPLVVQLLENLVDNALKYGNPAEPVLIGARRDGESVLLYVRDSGPGIPETLREAVFRPFIQGQVLPALAERPRGVGLGLALCRVIAAAHGGELRLDTSPAGSAFTFVLPLRSQPEYPHEPTTESQS
jgi:two-component system sensor histidine kinase KdpD